MKKIIEDSGLIVIFRGVDKVKAPKIANALYNAGVKVVEIAFNPSDENTIETTTGIIKAIIDEMGEKGFLYKQEELFKVTNTIDGIFEILEGD